MAKGTESVGTADEPNVRRLVFDGSPLNFALAMVRLFLPKASRESVDVFAGFINSGEQMVRTELDTGSAGTNELAVVAYPSDRFLVHLAALACDGNFGALENIGHDDSPSSDGPSPDDSAPEGAVNVSSGARDSSGGCA